MARNNFVLLYARVTKNPRISTDENGNFTRADVVLTTSKGERSSQNADSYIKSYEFDCPVMITKDPYLISKINEWVPDDIVLIKGVISSRDIDKISICSVCGKKNSRPGTVMYITPIYVQKVKHCKDEASALEELKNGCEISNLCIVAGNICENPKFYRNENGLCMTQYNIALNRKFRVVTDPASLKTDYPHVKSYGDLAVNDAMFLQTGATVLIEGYIHTRGFTKKCTCAHCGSEYETPDRAMEIIPYATEYLTGCRNVEDIEKMKKEQTSSAFEDIFGVRPKNEDPESDY